MEDKNEIKSLWLRVCQSADSKAFESLFALYYHRLLNFCLLYVRQKETAEEVVSDVFVKCWLNRQHLEAVRNPEVYLFVAVKNQALNYLKRFSGYQFVSIGEINANLLINSLYPEKELEKTELFFKMDQAINALPRQCRIIFRLIKEEGMKYKEVAAILHISPRTVQTQLFRAIKKLRQVMQPHLERKGPNPGSRQLLTALILLLWSIFFSRL